MERCRMVERRNFSKAFKIEAVRLLELGATPASELARELGIRRNLLYKWRDQLVGKGDRAFSGPGRPARSSSGSPQVPESDAAVIARLEGELKEAREERDILKKAAAYFARELP